MTKNFNRKILPALSYFAMGWVGITANLLTSQPAFADSVARCSSYSYDDVTAPGDTIVCSGDPSKKNPLGYYVFDKERIRKRNFGLKSGRAISNFTTAASASDLQAAGIQVSVGGGDGSGNGRNRGGRGRRGGGGSGSGDGGDDDSTRTTTRTTTRGGDTPCNGSGPCAGRGDDSDSTTTRTTTRTTRVTRNPRDAAKDERNSLADHCGKDGDFLDYDKERQTRLDLVIESLKKYAKDCTGEGCINLAAYADAKSAALNACHNDCKETALDPANAACSWEKLPGVHGLNEFCATLSKDDGVHSPRFDAFAKTSDIKNQGDCVGYMTAKPTDVLCKKMEASAGCAAFMRTDGFGCTGYITAAKAYDEAKSQYDNLMAEKDKLSKPTDSKKCSVASANDMNKMWTQRESLSVSCIQDVQRACGDALVSAQSQYETLSKTTTDYCATCDRDGYLPSCAYGGACGAGVSKFAQVVGAVGDVVRPLGLGAMNMAMFYKGQNTCLAGITLHVQQAQQVGLSPQNENCGGTGFGLGGFGGGMGMGGMGMNGMGMNGMNGMGFPGLNGQFGINANLGMPGMYPSFGTPPFMPGMYPGAGGQFGMNANMGMPGMGFPGGQMGMYGQGGGQGAYASVQAQMAADQSRMAALGMQNSIFAQAQNSGYGMAGQYGQGTPYYGMGQGYGMGQAYGMGQGSFGAYPNYGQYGGYNPASAIGFNLNAGLNLGGAGSYPSYGQGGSQYGQYGNYQPYQPTGSSCGFYQSGVPCGGGY